MYGYRAMGRWPAPRAGNIFDGSAYYYRCYACADSRWVAVGAIELQFRRMFLEKLGLGAELERILQSSDTDPAVHDRVAGVFRTHDRDHWQRVFEGTDACVSPVLAMDEVLEHPQNRANGTFADIAGGAVPRATPRFSRTPLIEPADAEHDVERRLADWDLPPAVAQRTESSRSRSHTRARPLRRTALRTWPGSPFLVRHGCRRGPGARIARKARYCTGATLIGG
jgi:crotonobetainyl-CoA:carnitine CoA-transferase CaiB-like acyl-CoA transferase